MFGGLFEGVIYTEDEEIHMKPGWKVHFHFYALFLACNGSKWEANKNS